MIEQTTIIDSINGREIQVVLNAPYQTLAAGSSFARSKEAKQFCKEHQSDFCLVVDDQIWASTKGGIALFAWVDQQLASLEIYGKALVLVPMDLQVYTVEVGEYGACVPGSESVVSLEQAKSMEDSGAVVIELGGLSALFNQAHVPLDETEKFRLKPIERELFAKRLFTPLHYGIAGVTAAVLSGTAAMLPTIVAGLKEETPVIVEQVITPRATDLAVTQLQYIDLALDEISYFMGRGLHSLKYDTQAGITLQGNYQHSSLMNELAADANDAGLTLVFGGEGWTVSKYPEIQRREPFDLNGFNENLLMIQTIAERFDLNTSIGSPSADLERRTIQVQLSTSSSQRLPLSSIAHSLQGVAATVQSLEIGFNGYEYAFFRINLNVSGRL